jgi:hypothetical protein
MRARRTKRKPIPGGNSRARGSNVTHLTRTTRPGEPRRPRPFGPRPGTVPRRGRAGHRRNGEGQSAVSSVGDARRAGSGRGDAGAGARLCAASFARTSRDRRCRQHALHRAAPARARRAPHREVAERPKAACVSRHRCRAGGAACAPPRAPKLRVGGRAESEARRGEDPGRGRTSHAAKEEGLAVHPSRMAAVPPFAETALLQRRIRSPSATGLHRTTSSWPRSGRMSCGLASAHGRRITRALSRRPESGSA